MLDWIYSRLKERPGRGDIDDFQVHLRSGFRILVLKVKGVAVTAYAELPSK